MPGISGLQNINLIFSKFQDVHQHISPYYKSANRTGEFSKLLQDTGFEVINCEYSEPVYNYPNRRCFEGDCGIHINLILKINFIEAISLWLLLNKPHSYSPIQHKFINQFIFLHMHATCFLQECKHKYTGRYNKSLRGLFLYIGICSEDGLWGRNVGWGCMRMGCWGGYLGVTRLS
jgi:hypothetical protein